MPWSLLLSLLLMGHPPEWPPAPPPGQANVIFYTESFTIPYATDILNVRLSLVQEKNLLQHCRALQQTQYNLLLQTLLRIRRERQLNDWLFYQLISNTLATIMPRHSANERELAAWLLLTSSGINTRITYHDQQVGLCVLALEDVFEAPLFEEGENTYVNLTFLQNPRSNDANPRQGIYVLGLSPQPKGRPFSFSLSQLPVLPAAPRARVLQFTYRDSLYRIPVEVDETIINMMGTYPLIAEAEYVKAPLSPTLEASLIPALRNLLRQKSSQEALQFLVSLTRNGFRYEDDQVFYGRSKPMIPDEVIYYPVSDCEDRCALFFSLVQELLELPMLVLAYPDHLTVAVAYPAVYGDPILYQGQRYYVCDPTGPANSSTIGAAPTEYRRQSFEIILASKPGE